MGKATYRTVIDVLSRITNSKCGVIEKYVRYRDWTGVVQGMVGRSGLYVSCSEVLECGACFRTVYGVNVSLSLSLLFAVGGDSNTPYDCAKESVVGCRSSNPAYRRCALNMKACAPLVPHYNVALPQHKHHYQGTVHTGTPTE